MPTASPHPQNWTLKSNSIFLFLCYSWAFICPIKVSRYLSKHLKRSFSTLLTAVYWARILLVMFLLTSDSIVCIPNPWAERRIQAKWEVKIQPKDWGSTVSLLNFGICGCMERGGEGNVKSKVRFRSSDRSKHVSFGISSIVTIVTSTKYVNLKYMSFPQEMIIIFQTQLSAQYIFNKLERRLRREMTSQANLAVRFTAKNGEIRKDIVSPRKLDRWKVKCTSMDINTCPMSNRCLILTTFCTSQTPTDHQNVPCGGVWLSEMSKIGQIEQTKNRH